MAVNNAIYLTSGEIARRAGVYDTAYVTTDLRFVLDIMDMKRVRFEAEEYINGLDGIERVTLEEAERLIAENKSRRIADMTDEPVEEEQQVEEPEPEAESEEEETENNEEE